MVASLILLYVIVSIVWFVMCAISLVQNRKKPEEERSKSYILKFIISFIMFFFAMCIVGLFVLAMMIVASM